MYLHLQLPRWLGFLRDWPQSSLILSLLRPMAAVLERRPGDRPDGALGKVQAVGGEVILGGLVLQIDCAIVTQISPENSVAACLLVQGRGGADRLPSGLGGPGAATIRA